MRERKNQEKKIYLFNMMKSLQRSVMALTIHWIRARNELTGHGVRFGELDTNREIERTDRSKERGNFIYKGRESCTFTIF